MAWQSGLSRWSSFVSSFDYIDAAIEAADPSVCRDEFRRLRMEIANMFGAAKDDACKTEGLCAVLDGVMAEALATLQTVPADAVPKVLAVSVYLADAVGRLRSHDSERVRGLAQDIIRGWKASVENNIAKMTAAIAKLDDVSQCPPCPKKAVPGVARVKTSAEASGPRKMAQQAPVKTLGCKTRVAKSNVPARVSALLPKTMIAPVIGVEKMVAPTKTPAVVGNGGLAHAGIDRTEATKRKLPAGYQEAENAKRQRKIGAVEAPKVVPKKTEMSSSSSLMKMAAKSNVTATKVSAPLPKTKIAPVIGAGRAGAVSTGKEMPPIMKVPATVANRGGAQAGIEDKMEATRRKLREGYQAAEDAKRQRKIVVIPHPTKPVNQQHRKMVEQNSRRKVHPIVQERSQARCGGVR